MLTLRQPVIDYHADQMGSTRALTDIVGTVAGTATYDSYGNPIVTKLTTPFEFAGEYRDAESGYTYLRARYYDPVTGQFLTRDPLVATTRSPYAYVYGDPVNSIDPSGLDCSPAPWDWGSCASDAASWVNSNVVQPVYNNVIQPAASWVANNSGTLLHVASVAAIVGVACGLGIVTAETTCVIAGGVAVGAGILGTAGDVDRAVRGDGSWLGVGLDALGIVSGVEGLAAASGSAKAICWGLASGFEAYSSEEINALSHRGG